MKLKFYWNNTVKFTTQEAKRQFESFISTMRSMELGVGEVFFLVKYKGRFRYVKGNQYSIIEKSEMLASDKV